MMISIQRLQRTSPWSKICASRGFESVKPRCLLKICFRRTCLFAPEIWSSGAHQTPTIGGTRVESSSGFGGNGEIPWDPPGKVWKPRIFDKNCRKCHNLLGQVFFSFFKCLAFLPSNQSQWPCWQRVLVTNAQCRPRYQYRAKPLKSRLPYAKNKLSKRCQISNGSKMATVHCKRSTSAANPNRWVCWCFLNRWFHISSTCQSTLRSYIKKVRQFLILKLVE